MLCLSGFELYSSWVPLKSGQLLMKLICRENTDYEFTRVFLLKNVSVISLGGKIH